MQALGLPHSSKSTDESAFTKRTDEMESQFNRFETTFEEMIAKMQKISSKCS